jgi:hypothetical protein
MKFGTMRDSRFSNQKKKCEDFNKNYLLFLKTKTNFNLLSIALIVNSDNLSYLYFYKQIIILKTQQNFKTISIKTKLLDVDLLNHIIPNLIANLVDLNLHHTHHQGFST